MLRSLELAGALLGAGIGYASMKSPVGIVVGALGGYGSVKAAHYVIENIKDIRARRFIVKLVTVGAANTLVYVLTGSEVAALLAGAAALHVHNQYIQQPLVGQYNNNVNRPQTTVPVSSQQQQTNTPGL